jgi:hypothetical protein
MPALEDVAQKATVMFPQRATSKVAASSPDPGASAFFLVIRIGCCYLSREV